MWADCIGPKLGRATDLSTISGSCRRGCFSVLKTTLETRKAVFEHRVECQTHTPGKVVVINSSPLIDQDNNFAGAVLVIRDITRLADLEKRGMKNGRLFVDLADISKVTVQRKDEPGKAQEQKKGPQYRI